MPFPDFYAPECGLKKALLGKQTRLFCSFHSTAICLRRGTGKICMSQPYVTKRGLGSGAWDFLAGAALVSPRQESRTLRAAQPLASLAG